MWQQAKVGKEVGQMDARESSKQWLSGGPARVGHNVARGKMDDSATKRTLHVMRELQLF